MLILAQAGWVGLRCCFANRLPAGPGLLAHQHHPSSNVLEDLALPRWPLAYTHS